MSNPWIIHLKGVRKENPNLSYKQCMQKGKLSYKKQRGGGIAGDAVSTLWSGIKTIGKGAAVLAIHLPLIVLQSEVSLIKHLKSQPDGGVQQLKEGLTWVASVLGKTGIDKVIFND
jgi:hypothetical protein